MPFSICECLNSDLNIVSIQSGSIHFSDQLFSNQGVSLTSKRNLLGKIKITDNRIW